MLSHCWVWQEHRGRLEIPTQLMCRVKGEGNEVPKAQHLRGSEMTAALSQLHPWPAAHL